MSRKTLGVFVAVSLLGLAFVTARLARRDSLATVTPPRAAATPAPAPPPAKTIQEPPKDGVRQSSTPLAAPVEAPRADVAATRSVEGGVAGGVEGGVPGGVVGGVVGGLPDSLGRVRVEREAKRSASGQDFQTEAYDRIQDNPFLAAAQNPLSTF